MPTTSRELHLFDHVHDLDRRHYSLRRPKQFEPRHGVYHSFDGLLVLFNDAIELVDRASWNASLVLLVNEPVIC